MKTPLAYYGGKQSLADRLVALMPPHRLYLEPFAGGAAVLFAKPRAAYETINDVDGAIVAFWRAVRERPDELADALALTPYARDEWRACRAGLDDETVDVVERARRLLVTIDQSYTRCGDTWSPPSKMDEDRAGRWQAGSWLRLPPLIEAACERLTGVAIENTDAVEMLAKWDRPGALIYCDPPYTGPERLRTPGGSSVGARGYRYDTTPDLWPRLVDQLVDLRHAAVLLSGYPSTETAHLENAGWAPISLATRRASGNRRGDGGMIAPETVWISPICEPPTRSLFDHVEAIA